MTMPSPLPQQALREFDRRLAIIHHTYPAWSVRRRPNNTWIAVRAAELTPAQIEAGAQHFIVRRSLDELVEAMGDELIRAA
ncbi:hypothetical protein ABGB18_42440 [Nonomuraea sp. B12E4]|uniref:hypothetical protein n=1 Tax=Nonomuraea sp. B12E4 TaxID=3153564 RepID=UPI00325EFF35